MSTHRIVVTKIEPTEGSTVTGTTETEVFRQCFDDFDLKRFACTLNKPVRTRKTRKATATP